MNLRSLSAAALFAIGGLVVGVGTAGADPAPADTVPGYSVTGPGAITLQPEPPQTASAAVTDGTGATVTSLPLEFKVADSTPAAAGLKYSVKLVDKTVVATLKGGTFALVERPGDTPDAPKAQIVDIKDDKGATVLSLPLEFKVDGAAVPVKAVAAKDNTVLELTPDKPAGVQVADRQFVVKPIASAVEDERARNDFSSKFGLATTIGQFVGTAIGAGVGCVFGLPLFGVGCLPGIVTGASIGGLIGTIVAGGPTLVVAGIDLLNTMQAEPGTTKWADKPQVESQPQVESTAPTAADVPHN
ncbi:hypothetical protein [Nocardia arthritidis]|uniref:DUF8020 domain-containing protein n=1 Tax=Nocardia arthritidis TaxID=228602 RepID=A0A6G9YU43_9NOCA|nr:hypothetical protein [Nocardia arthritidis]QIS16670.1 hypothetical protein F5544_44335 [Nocardia arthritidis]